MTRSFDYEASAELYAAPARINRRVAMSYRRFSRAADAIRFAVEELSPGLLNSAYMEVDDGRFDMAEIRELYRAPGYPAVRAGDGAMTKADAADLP